MRSYTRVAAVLSLLSAFSEAAPAKLQGRSQQLVINADFPDPSIEQDFDGKWYAFGSESPAGQPTGNKIQVATANTPGGPWTLLAADALPNSGSWTTQIDNWAPEVRRVSSGKYVMFYSGALASSPTHHCIGVATATNIVGPYTAASAPIACPPLDQGGAIDPTAFYDADTQTPYIAYKVDGNSVGNGGNCNNGVAPLKATPIQLQKLTPDWLSRVGDPIQILDRDDSDGPLVEAPSLIRAADGTYVLTYSTHCYTDPGYDVKYATSPSLSGPYTKQGELIKSGDFGGLVSPGSATMTPDGKSLLFHANCPAGRCMHVTDLNIATGGVVSFA